MASARSARVVASAHKYPCATRFCDKLFDLVPQLPPNYAQIGLGKDTNAKRLTFQPESAILVDEHIAVLKAEHLLFETKSIEGEWRGQLFTCELLLKSPCAFEA